jgi:hypothetical protein
VARRCRGCLEALGIWQRGAIGQICRLLGLFKQRSDSGGDLGRRQEHGGQRLKGDRGAIGAADLGLDLVAPTARRNLARKPSPGIKSQSLDLNVFRFQSRVGRAFKGLFG